MPSTVSTCMARSREPNQRQRSGLVHGKQLVNIIMFIFSPRQLISLEVFIGYFMTDKHRLYSAWSAQSVVCMLETNA